MAPPRPPKKEFVHPEASHAKKKNKNPGGVEPISAFYMFLGANLISAVFAPIQDCDETFNYWEPTHYLTHGYGLQTWEYSPDYAIRSWFYIGLHALMAGFRRLLPQSSKVGEFYFVRYVFAFVCALCQTLMFNVISGTINPRIGFFFVLALCTSPGNFHASTAFLPSTFAMYFVMLGGTSFMNWRGGVKTVEAMTCFGIAAVLGWPFAWALCVPFLLEEFILAIGGGQNGIYEGFIRGARGVIATGIVAFVDAGVNTFFYKKVVSAAWNIVYYNVLSSDSSPDLYGTEPWTFYFKNLALNFNVWFALALLSLPLFTLQKIIGASRKGILSGMRAIVFLLPFYMWLAIFTLQPHKEERFMYPVYPFLALNAAMSLHILLEGYGQSAPGTLMSKIPTGFKLVTVMGAFIIFFLISLLRIYGLYSAYGAPLSLYKPLGGHNAAAGEAGIGGPGDFVCFGKDWYRFPNSFFLPRGMRAKFVRSEFRGLLPGEFSEAQTGFGLWSGTWLPPSGMNNQNKEDGSKYTDIKLCEFLVDTQFPENAKKGLELPPREPDYVADTEHWDVVQCLPFLDATNTPFLPRALWIPNLSFLPEKFQRKWAKHCLLRRRKQ